MALEQATILSRRDFVVLTDLAETQERSGNTEDADAIIQDLMTRSFLMAEPFEEIVLETLLLRHR